MAKYRLLNEYGNRVFYTDNEREKNSLLDKGFHIENLPKAKETKTAVKENTEPKAKRKAVKKNEGKVED